MVAAHRPDVLVLDLNMPGPPSLPAIPELARAAPPSWCSRCRTTRRSRARRCRSGARGYVLKEAADAELRRRRARRRRRAAPTSTRSSARAWPPRRRRPTGPPDDLTERELEILRLIALGHTNAEIGEQLYLSVRTVESHRAHIQQKTRRSDARGAGPLRARPRAARRLSASEREDAPSPRSRALDVSISSSPPISAARSRIPASPKPAVGLGGVEAARRRRRRARAARSAPCSTVDVDARGAGVLADVGQRLLHEPVDRGLELRVERVLVDAHVERRPPGLRPRAARRPSPSSGGHEPELVERGRDAAR